MPVAVDLDTRDEVRMADAAIRSAHAVTGGPLAHPADNEHVQGVKRRLLLHPGGIVAHWEVASSQVRGFPAEHGHVWRPDRRNAQLRIGLDFDGAGPRAHGIERGRLRPLSVIAAWMWLEAVADPADGADMALFEPRLPQLVAELAHVDGDVAVIAVPVLTPQQRREVLIGHDAARPRCERDQDLELSLREVDRHAMQPYLPCSGVDDEIAEVPCGVSVQH